MNENVPAIAKICQWLDGIPLALELAAARLRTLSVEQITARLDDSFRLLTGGTRTALPRQQTLRALIDWSYNLLSEPEKTLFRRLAVFVDGWTLEAAESVCSDLKGGINSEDVLELLDHLVDKSLVISVQDGHETRYRRVEIIRQSSREKLAESGEGTTHRDRHLANFLKWVSHIEPNLRSPQQVELLSHLENTIDNLRAALEWSQDSDPESGLQLASRLKWFWFLYNLFEEGTGWKIYWFQVKRPVPKLVRSYRQGFYPYSHGYLIGWGTYKPLRPACMKARSCAPKIQDRFLT